ncbi:hypothetical protein E2C01_063858 [Portunus trituberculatus]|uniref:Uncharacterized protein n=1 Tax=Portunus trituberculatus TaxID=210409 RepID=A0A5B7HLP9_PORTR|nr:hypothetical protein [Portunus trituberculatus]
MRRWGRVTCGRAASTHQVAAATSSRDRREEEHCRPIPTSPPVTPSTPPPHRSMLTALYQSTLAGYTGDNPASGGETREQLKTRPLYAHLS